MSLLLPVMVGATLLGAVARPSAAGASRAPTAAPGVKTYTLYSHGLVVGPYGTKLGGGPTASPGVDGFITHMDARVVSARTGVVVPQYRVMLHHLVVMNSGTHPGERRDGACPYDHNQRFFGTSEELRALDLPAGFGYPITAHDHWLIGVMLMNHTFTTREVRIRYTVRVERHAGLVPVTPYWLSVQSCGADPQYSIAGGGDPGSSATRSAEYTMPTDGRIVAVGGHLHGGARSLTLDQPRCGARLVTARPTYAPESDPLYRIYPRLHEADPKSISWWQSGAGIPVIAGEKLVVSANYANENPYMRVMGIMHVYVAAGYRPAGACDPSPPARTRGPGFAGGRHTPPHTEIVLASSGSDGHAHPISAPPGSLQTLDGDTDIAVRGFSFRPPNISIPQGASVTWRFQDDLLHDATLASGPRGFASSYSRAGQSFHQTFALPGTYRLFCSLHPTAMSQTIVVRPGASASASASRVGNAAVAPSPPAGAWPFRP